MIDEHLNLFHTYNRDTELIENNLTRAFLLTLSLVTPDVRQFVLSRLLTGGPPTSDLARPDASLDFGDASFALQSHMDPDLSRSAMRKLLLTLSTEPLADPGAFPPSDTDRPMSDQVAAESRSVPDGWVFRQDRSYCILIEAKVGTYPLDIGQLSAHVRDWFGVGCGTPPADVQTCSTTWTDVLATLDRGLSDVPHATDQDGAILDHLAEFIGRYGYRLFRGIDLTPICSSPAFRIRTRGEIAGRLDFGRLMPPPQLRLSKPRNS